MACSSRREVESEGQGVSPSACVADLLDSEGAPLSARSAAGRAGDRAARGDDLLDDVHGGNEQGVGAECKVGGSVASVCERGEEKGRGQGGEGRGDDGGPPCRETGCHMGRVAASCAAAPAGRRRRIHH